MRAVSKRWAVTAAVLAVVWMAACAPGANPMAAHPVEPPPAGFLLGLWHGVIIWVTFIVSLFDHDVSIYEVHNSGWPYNLGFLIGAAGFHGGGAFAGARRRRG